MNQISQLTNLEYTKQRDTLNLIASENYPSKKTLEFLGSVWSNKYAEGYPNKRYYTGNIYVDELENFVQQKALQVFDKTGEYGVNVQVLSGSPANSMVFLSVLEYGDTVLSLNIANGGHISHLHKTSSWLKFFKLVNYDVSAVGENTFEVDLNDFKQKLSEFKPKLVIIGFSAYPRQYKFTEMIRTAHEAGSLVLADIAHINGLVAANLHDSPFKAGAEGADFVSMTTHKTFRGPRSAMLFAKKYFPDNLNTQFTTTKSVKGLIDVINKTVFPGTSGGPHLHQIAAVGQACLEILGVDQHPDGVSFENYSRQILKNCKALENSLSGNGLQIISPTQNHLCLVKLPEKTDGHEEALKLEKIGVICNKNGVPFDTGTPWRPTGIRLGTAALTSRGLTEEMAEKIGQIIADSIFDRKTKESLKSEVSNISQTLKWWY